MIYLTWHNITLSKTLGGRSFVLSTKCILTIFTIVSDRSIDRSGYGAFINENNPSSLAKGVRRVLLVANSSGESMLSKGIATHSESVIQPACIESMLVRHPRGFSLRRSTSRVSHTCARSRTRIRTHGRIFTAREYFRSRSRLVP